MAAPETYGELQDEVARLRERGQVADALALVRAEGPRFPDQIAWVHLWRVSLSVALGDLEGAIRALDEALAAGCRYPMPMLMEWPAAAPLRDIVEFERLVHISSMRYDAELAAAHASVIVERPDLVAPPQGLPLLVVLHGNNATAERELPHWRAALSRGVILAVPRSAEISLSPGVFVWNDADRAHIDVIDHVERLVREQRIDPDRIVLAGYSMGALRALELAYSPALHARAAIAVAPWLPVKDVERLASGRPVRTFINVGVRDAGGFEGSAALAEQLRQRGTPVEMDTVAGLGHRYPQDWGSVLVKALDFALAG